MSSYLDFILRCEGVEQDLAEGRITEEEAASRRAKLEEEEDCED
jgi:hypothetical protein